MCKSVFTSDENKTSEEANLTSCWLEYSVKRHEGVLDLTLQFLESATTYLRKLYPQPLSRTRELRRKREVRVSTYSIKDLLCEDVHELSTTHQNGILS